MDELLETYITADRAENAADWHLWRPGGAAEHETVVTPAEQDAWRDLWHLLNRAFDEGADDLSAVTDDDGRTLAELLATAESLSAARLAQYDAALTDLQAKTAAREAAKTALYDAIRGS